MLNDHGPSLTLDAWTVSKIGMNKADQLTMDPFMDHCIKQYQSILVNQFEYQRMKKWKFFLNVIAMSESIFI